MSESYVGSASYFDPRTRGFRVFGLVEALLRLDDQQSMSLPRATTISDVHGVTAWGRLDTEGGGSAGRAWLSGWARMSDALR